MDRRYSKHERSQRLHASTTLDAEVLEVRSHSLLVEHEGIRLKVESTPVERNRHWVGQRIELEISDDHVTKAGRGFARLADEYESRGMGDPDKWRWLEDTPHGTLVEGRVIRRLRASVLLDLGHGCQVSTYPGHFMGSMCRRYGKDCLPQVGESLAMAFHGFRPDGAPALYAWNHERDPKFHRYDAGYRSRYRGEDSAFAVLPWKRSHPYPR